MDDSVGIVATDVWIVRSACKLNKRVTVLQSSFALDQTLPITARTTIGPLYNDRAVLMDFGSRNNVVVCDTDVPTPAIRVLQRLAKKIFPDDLAMELHQDRLMAKKIFEYLQIPHCRAIKVNSRLDLREAPSTYVLKSRYRDFSFTPIRVEDADWDQLLQKFGDSPVQLIAEEVPVSSDRTIWGVQEYRLSKIGIRGAAGESVFYPLMITLYEQSKPVLTKIVNLEGKKDTRDQQAEEAISKVFWILNYLGPLTVEFQDVGGKLYATRIAPITHPGLNLTVSTADADYLENTIRALTSMPLNPNTGIPPYSGIFHVYQKMQPQKPQSDKIQWFKGSFGALNWLQVQIKAETFGEFINLSTATLGEAQKLSIKTLEEIYSGV